MLSGDDAALPGAWVRFLTWLRTSSKVAQPWRDNGECIADNLAGEAHLVDGRAFGDASALSGFMSQCARAFEDASTEEQKVDAFRQTCRDNVRKGLLIGMDSLPDLLCRYGSEVALEIALQRMVGDYALLRLQRKRMSLQEAGQQVKLNWNPALLGDGDMLGRADRGFTWATYDAGTMPASAGAEHVAACLALPCVLGDGRPRRRSLVKLTYPKDSVRNHRFPTIAEAETFPYFSPAAEVPPNPSEPATCVGWTKPLAGGEPQPELIHDNAPLRVLSAPIELVGSFVA